MQLFIFPYAGGSIASFKKLTDRVSKDIEVITVEYAGRGTRAKEPLAESFEALREDAASYCRLRRERGVPCAVMGYSMGSILAYELISRHVLDDGLIHLFIAAEVSPKDRSLELRKLKDPTDEQIFERAKRLGGLDERLLKNERFWDIYIKPMLSDYRLFFEYKFAGGGEKIKTDATFFYCENDTALKDVQKWSELIDGRFDFHEMGENHFFINQHYAEMAGFMNESLSSF